MKQAAFSLLFHVFLYLGIFSNIVEGSESQICQQPKERPVKTREHPGYYNVMIVLNSCNDEVYINNNKIKYSGVKGALDSWPTDDAVDRLSIFVGDFEPCQETPADLVDNALKQIFSQLSGNPSKVHGLHLYNLDDYNFQLIQAVKDTVSSVLLQNCNQMALSDGLTAVEGCEFLESVLIFGPAEFAAVRDALHAKSELARIEILQASGAQNAEGLGQLFKTLPKLKSVLLKCDGSCQTDYEKLVEVAAEEFGSMGLVSLKRDNEEIDTTGVELSKVLGPKLYALYLRGSRAIRCEHMAEIMINLLRIPQTTTFSTRYLTVEHDCPTIDELWSRVGDKLKEGETLSRCRYDMTHCRRVAGPGVLIQIFRD